MSGTVEDALDTALRTLPPRPHRSALTASFT